MAKRVARGVVIGVLAVAMPACSSSSGGGPPNLQKALTDYFAGNKSKAKTEFEAVAKADPNNKYAWYNLGVIAYDSGDLAKSDEDYLKAIKIDPSFESALFNYGYSRYKNGDNEQAITYLRRAIAADPTGDASAHLYLGLSLTIKDGDTPSKALAKEATDELNRALQLDPNLKKDLRQTLGLVPTGGTGGVTATTVAGSAATSTSLAGPAGVAPTTVATAP